MSYRGVWVAIAAGVLLGGCVSTVVPVDVEGSRADGTVLMAVQASGLHEVDWEKSLATARERCRAWGFQDVEAFGGWRQFCEAPGLFGCTRMRYERQYQCLESAVLRLPDDVLPDEE